MLHMYITYNLALVFSCYCMLGIRIFNHDWQLLWRSGLSLIVRLWVFELITIQTNCCNIAGWLSILVGWSRSSDLALSLLAGKALANLQSSSSLPYCDQSEECPIYLDGVYLYHPLLPGTRFVIIGSFEVGCHTRKYGNLSLCFNPCRILYVNFLFVCYVMLNHFVNRFHK